MIRFKAIYLSLVIAILMTLGCIGKDWTAGTLFWGILSVLCAIRITRLNLRERAAKKEKKAAASTAKKEQKDEAPAAKE